MIAKSNAVPQQTNAPASENQNQNQTHPNLAGNLFFTGHPASDSLTNQDQLIAGGVQYIGQNDLIEEKGQPYFTLRMFQSGSCEVNIEGETIHTFPGSLILQKPNCGISIKPCGTNQLAQYFVSFSFASDQPHNSRSSYITEQNHFYADTKITKTLFETMIIAGTHANSLSEELCFNLIEFIANQMKATNELTVPKVDLARESYARTKAYIEENFSTINNMEEVALACNLSTPHISRVFKRFGKQAPTEYLFELRMQRSIELLSQGKFLIKEISNLVGFRDPYYFSTCFKRYFGKSPKFYQQ